MQQHANWLCVTLLFFAIFVKVITGHSIHQLAKQLRALREQLHTTCLKLVEVKSHRESIENVKMFCIRRKAQVIDEIKF